VKTGVPHLRLSLGSLSLLAEKLAAERPGAVKGTPGWGGAKRTLDSEDRSEMIGREGKASESSVEGGPAKMAPSPAALNIL